MSKQNNPSSQDQSKSQNSITSNAFLENVMPQIKINQQAFPLNDFDSTPADSGVTTPQEEKKLR